MALAVVYGRFLLVAGTLVATALLLAGAVVAARKAHLKSLGRRPPAEAFSLEQLQELRDAGQISQEEFSFLRRQALNLPPPEQKGQADMKRAPGT